MSKVAIKGNASGTATYTLEAPAGSTDRTLTLPDEAGTVLTSGTPLSSFPSGFANGITEADHYRMTTDLTSDGVITSWERPDDVAGSATIGSGVSVSSGVFTFPETGIYLVLARSYIVAASGDSVNYQVEYTANNSTYTIVTWAFNDADGSLTVPIQRLFDITDTANQKIRLAGSSISAGSRLDGLTTNDRTTVTFVRLGDT